MKDETLDFFEQLEEKQKNWKKQYVDIDPLLEELRQSLNGDIEKWEHDYPTRSLHWVRADGLECSISMFLESNLKIWGMAWKDEEKKSERWLRKEVIFKEITLPFPQGKLRTILYDIADNLNKTTLMDLDSKNPVNLIPRNL